MEREFPEPPETSQQPLGLSAPDWTFLVFSSRALLGSCGGVPLGDAIVIAYACSWPLRRVSGT